MTTLFRTSLAKLLSTPSFQFGISNVEVWHHGLSASSRSIVAEKQPDQPSRGKAVQVVDMRRGWMRFARLRVGVG